MACAIPTEGALSAHERPRDELTACPSCHAVNPPLAAVLADALNMIRAEPFAR